MFSFFQEGILTEISFKVALTHFYKSLKLGLPYEKSLSQTKLPSNVSNTKILLFFEGPLPSLHLQKCLDKHSPILAFVFCRKTPLISLQTYKGCL